jgi:pyruvate dehydrogenase E2 component (dihydrolipoamide acetyltransferase)
MSIDITMPALSPTMEEGNLAKWMVKEGDTVSAGDVIAEIETDKATMEVEAVDEGVVAKLLVAEGAEGVKVNTVIAVLAEDGEDASAVEVGAKPAAEAEPASKEEAPTTPATTEAKTSPAPQAAPVAPSGNRVFATPLARRIAEQNGVDLSSIAGSGPHGRIVKADVEGKSGSAAQTKAPASASSAATASAPVGMSDEAVLSLFEEGSFEKKPHDGMQSYSRTFDGKRSNSAILLCDHELRIGCFAGSSCANEQRCTKRFRRQTSLQNFGQRFHRQSHGIGIATSAYGKCILDIYRPHLSFHI